jgi:plastocyanin
MSRRFLTVISSTAFHRIAYGVGVVGVTAAVSSAFATVGTPRGISQKGKAFFPSAVSIKVGDDLVIKNDDTDVVHHAYTDDERFSFDSGDQVPGASSDVVFTKAGTFTVMCGIHPKMKLIVEVH